MVRVSTNQRFLQTEDGQPFFWLGDTAWELFHRLTLDEADDYLENRRKNGFNVIQSVALAEFDGLNAPNPYGETPLVANDPLQPNDAYFRHVDAIIDMAAQKGLYIGLLPTWGDKVFRLWGVGPQIFNEDKAYAYGQWIAARYQDRANVIWINGGDRPEERDGVNVTAVWRRLAAGIRSVVGRQALMTYHPSGGGSSANYFHEDDWLDLNMWQSGHSRLDSPNWDMIARDYARQPTKPMLDGEPNYEDHPINPFTRKWIPEYGCFTEYDVRKQAYRAVFAGACGHTYGHHAVWQFYEEKRKPVNFPQMPWRQAIERPGAAQLKHLVALVKSRPYFERIPDQSLIASDARTGAAHIQATRAADGSFAFVYLPQACQSVTVDARPLSGQKLNAWWYDPRIGTTTPIGEVEKSADLLFTTPDTGPDWVLVLDDTARQFGIPGNGRSDG
jgi:hypothetical protein